MLTEIRQVNFFDVVVYFTSGNCTSGPTVTETNTTTYILPTATPPYYVGYVTSITYTESGTPVTTTSSEQY